MLDVGQSDQAVVGITWAGTSDHVIEAVQVSSRKVKVEFKLYTKYLNITGGNLRNALSIRDKKFWKL